jgi:uncharacterized protein YeaO (DUF488 family)
MMTKSLLKQDDKTELDLQLEKELEGTFPASDPLKITRFPLERHEAAGQQDDTDKVRCNASMNKKIAPDHIKLKRAYEPPASNDGTRILIDRLWPRGVKKADAGIDEWMKDIAPSTALRKWFGHAPERWPEFRRRYRAEIEKQPEQFHRLRALAQREQITLVFSAHDEEHNDAVVLKELLLEPFGLAHRGAPGR